MITPAKPSWVVVTQRQVRIEHRGEVGDYLDTRWMAQLAGHRLLPLPNHLPTVRHTLTGLPIAAIVLTGGNDLSTVPGGTDIAPGRDEVEGWLLDYAERSTIPVIGVCRGAQALAVRVGARVTDDRLGHAGTRHGVRTVATTPWGWPETFTVTSHHRHVLPAAGLPDKLRALALADRDDTVEAFEHVCLPWWGLMWHPEREDPPGPASCALNHLLQSPDVSPSRPTRLKEDP